MTGPWPKTLIFPPEVHSSPLVLPALAADWTVGDNLCIPLYKCHDINFIEHSLLQCCDVHCVRIAHAHLTPYVMYMDRTRLHSDSISDSAFAVSNSVSESLESLVRLL